LGSLAVSLMEHISWRIFFLMCGIFFCALTLVCSKWIVLPEDHHLPERKKAAADNDFSTKEMVRTSSFWYYFLWNMSANGCGMVLIGHSSPMTLELGSTLAVATLAASLAALSRAIGGILSGFVYDRYGYRKCMTMVSAFLLIGVLIMIAAGFLKSVPLILIGITVNGLGFGGSTANNIAIMNEFFGQKYFGTNFSILNQCVIPGALIGSAAVGCVRTVAGAYLPSFLIPLAVSLLSIFCLWRLRPPVKK